MAILKNKTYGLVFSLMLFLLLSPFSSSIRFMQNDDWYYYEQVNKFLMGNFTLNSAIAPTFYLQGYLGAFFANLFSLTQLPILTLVVSIITFYIFYLLLLELSEFLSRKPLIALLISLLFFACPLYVYGIFGFMTENYFLLFFVLSIYFFVRYEKLHQSKFLLLFNAFSILGFFVRQISFVTLLASSLYFLLTKRYKQFVIQAGVFAFLYGFYLLVFPKTLEMGSKSFQFQHLLKIDYVLALVIGTLIYLTAYTLPLVVALIVLWLKSFSISKIVLVAVLTGLLFLGMSEVFKPLTVSWGEFPYFENTVERRGFLPREVHGTKYYFKGMFDLYKYWDMASRVVLCVFVSSLVLTIVTRRKVEKGFLLFATYFGVYMFVMILTVSFYDRYITVLIPTTIIVFVYLFSKEVSKMPNSFSDIFKLFVFQKLFSTIFIFMLMGFVAGLAYYSYLFSVDFIKANNYIWGKSQSIIETNNIDPKLIDATSAWNKVYKVDLQNAIYLFTYDSPEVLNNPSEYKLLEQTLIDSQGSIFIEPYVYLYIKL